MVALTILGRDGRRADREQRRADILEGTQVQKQIQRAEKHRKRADAATKSAKVANAEMEKRLDQAARKNGSHADILSAWDAERLRQQQSG